MTERRVVKHDGISGSFTSIYTLKLPFLLTNSVFRPQLLPHNISFLHFVHEWAKYDWLILLAIKFKKPTWKFSSILFGFTLLGITTMPRWIWNLIQIWAGDFPYFSAISAIVGFFNKAGSSAVAHGRSGEPSGLYAVTNKEPKHLKITYCNIEEQRHRVSNQIHSRKSNYFEYDII